MDFLPDINLLVAMLGGLLLINQIRLRRQLLNTIEVQAIQAESVADTEKNLTCFAEIAEATEDRITTVALDVAQLKRDVQAVSGAPAAAQRAAADCRASREDTLAAGRQLIENMIVGQGTQYERRLKAVEAAVLGRAPGGPAQVRQIPSSSGPNEVT